ncbi:polyhomeotic-like protein 3 [Oncorhynchus nerka]|uniref:polyhomeotic-like protein 3 n=1 Tax=Oncorhynchus nerka TaxID=8023 RepID=UPI0031B7F979
MYTYFPLTYSQPRHPYNTHPQPYSPTLTPSLPTPTHAPTKVTHKPVPFPLTPPTIHFTSPLLTPSRSSPTVSAITSLPPSSVNHGNMSSAPGTSSLTNGNARPVPTPTSLPITPFHTPASRQIHFPRPLDTPTLVQAYQSTSSVRQRVSQQALLLGRTSCSSQDQMLLRTQMLQSLTLPPLCSWNSYNPPSLRLKPPSSSSHSPISRPHLSQSCPETFSLLERKPWSQRVWPEGGACLPHLVEGFIIQEGLQQTTLGPRERHRGVLHCESCGKRGHAHSFHRSKRYCSTSCARRYNVGLSKRLRALSAGSQPEGRRSEINKVESVPGKPLLLRLPREIWSAHRRDNEEEEGYAVPTAARLERRAARRARRASEPAMTPGNSTVTSSDSLPAQWSVEQVWDFIHTLPGCVEVAEAFRVQEIDGQALLLLTEDHLMTSMNIKLGPALKICAHINTLRHR